MASLCTGDEQFNPEKGIMKTASQYFLQELEQAIGDHPDKVNILAEYELHVHEWMKEEGAESVDNYSKLIERLGSPQEIALLWRQEAAITPKKTQWLFVGLNIAMFLGGVILTIIYNVFSWHWVEQLWHGLTETTFIIMIVYTLFWGLLGYEIGKEFGDGGRRLLHKTFIVSVVPNLLLMYLTLFKVIPYEWFQPLLNVPFIMLCIGFTVVLYPVCLVGFRWGRKLSV